MIDFKLMRSTYAIEMLGWLPQFFSENDPRPAREQIDENYSHGGGWRVFDGFDMHRPSDDPLTWQLIFDGDPPTRALAVGKMREETIVLFDYSWVAIVQPNGSFEVARCD